MIIILRRLYFGICMDFPPVVKSYRQFTQQFVNTSSQQIQLSIFLSFLTPFTRAFVHPYISFSMEFNTSEQPNRAREMKTTPWRYDAYQLFTIETTFSYTLRTLHFHQTIAALLPSNCFSPALFVLRGQE